MCVLPREKGKLVIAPKRARLADLINRNIDADASLGLWMIHRITFSDELLDSDWAARSLFRSSGYSDKS